MAALKYKDENGNYQTVVGVNMLNEVVQTTGSSTTAVMSQKAVSDLIPAQASLNNQLADKDFVNSSITTATATYQGSYNLVSDLELTTQASHGTIEQALNTEIASADNNDYSFVQIPTSDSTPTEIASVERYKYNGTTWSYEYAINNSGFTAAQWAAVNSNITSGLVAQLNAFSNNSQTSISKVFGMDANGNFQNISTSELKSVLDGSKTIYTGTYKPVSVGPQILAPIPYSTDITKVGIEAYAYTEQSDSTVQYNTLMQATDVYVQNATYTTGNRNCYIACNPTQTEINEQVVYYVRAYYR